ncbi:MAG: class I adenylate cyclase [Gammaproteobacteria bacterium]|nr:class I adenylate cyclase [Gammaproteobacteria bacterium]
MTPQQRFAAINRERLLRAQDCLTTRQRLFIELAPLLFHVNGAGLPGYCGDETPAGISNYTPTRRTLETAARLSPGFRFDRHIHRSYPLKGMYVMGSPGTIAHASDSDFDIWLCHGPDLSMEQLMKIQDKARGIEAWAASLGLEAHFFVFDAERFRDGETLSLSAESSGSSQHLLLLDEFYRSGLVLAGLHPLWWAVPPEHEDDYEAYVDEEVSHRRLKRDDFVDFGSLANIPPDEFFGAAVWQLSKSIGSPYKSVQKLMLMEAYAAGYPAMDLVSRRYKHAVYEGTRALNEMDPYVLMHNKAAEYLMAQKDSMRLDVLRRGFYLKAGCRLSRPPSSGDALWRREMLQELVESWNWSAEQLSHLDAREAWNIESVREERRSLIKALTQSYSRLSEFAREHGKDSRITQSDLTVLGRKLYAAFERKPGKIEIIAHGITSNLFEDALTLQSRHSDGGEQRWFLYRGLVATDSVGDRAPLKQAGTVHELVSWCYFNKLCNSGTTWHLFTDDTAMKPAMLRSMLKDLAQRFPDAVTEPSKGDALSKAPRIVRSIMFANTGVDPMESRVRSGDALTTSNTDALHFGGQRINLIQSLDVLLATTWQELYCFHYRGVAGMLQALCEYLRFSPLTEQVPPPAPVVQCYSPQYGNIIADRIQQLFDDITDWFYEDPDGSNRHFVLESEGRFYRISAIGSRPETVSYKGYGALLSSLAELSNVHNDFRFDPGSLPTSPLPVMYVHNHPGRLEVFVERRQKKSNLYVIDEHGCLTTMTSDRPDTSLAIANLRRFLETVQTRQALSGDATTTETLPIAYFELEAKKGGYVARRFRPKLAPADFCEVKVIGDLDDDEQTVFSVYCDDEEFSTASHGAGVLEHAGNYLMTLRAGRGKYPIFITDIDLSARLLAARGVEHAQSAYLLQQKKRIELRLTRALH